LRFLLAESIWCVFSFRSRFYGLFGLDVSVSGPLILRLFFPIVLRLDFLGIPQDFSRGCPLFRFMIVKLAPGYLKNRSPQDDSRPKFLLVFFLFWFFFFFFFFLVPFSFSISVSFQTPPLFIARHSWPQSRFIRRISRFFPFKYFLINPKDL